MVKVGVLVPLHNEENLVVRSLLSVLNQQDLPSDFEGTIHCVLNCCTDNTEKLIQGIWDNLSDSSHYEDTNSPLYKWNIMTHHEDTEKGLIPAMNTGLIHMFKENYDFIARQDGDDYWYPNKLSKQLSYMDQHKDVDILGTQVQSVDEFGNAKYRQEPSRPLDHDSIKKTLMGGWNCMAHPSVLIRPRIFLRCGMYSGILPEDYQLWLMALNWYKLANLPEVLVDYTARHNPNYDHNRAQAACYIANFLAHNFHGPSEY